MATLRKQKILPELFNSPITNLRDDLLVEILIRLPNPRSACRCKPVCKRWSSLISGPYFNRHFVSHHQSRKGRDPPLLFRSDDPQSIILSFLPVPDEVRPYFIVWDSFKDLLLCGFMDFDARNGELGRSYLICNPFTKQWIALPLAPEKTMRYWGSDTRLVCEPRSESEHNLELGDGQVFVYSEYRFRVVCIYQSSQPNMSLKLDVFCSESGEWIKEALVLDGHLKAVHHNIVSCNGELFWSQFDSRNRPNIAVFNPFRLDIPPTSIDATVLFNKSGNISVCQGALHVITLEAETNRDSSRNVLSVWRLEEDHKSWRRWSEVLLNTSRCNYELKDTVAVNLLPENPEIVFLEYRNHSGVGFATLSCDMRRGELEFFAEISKPVLGLMVLQPMVSCWPTPIPRYEELQGRYNGSYNCLVQSHEAKTPLITGLIAEPTEECQVEES